MQKHRASSSNAVCEHHRLENAAANQGSCHALFTHEAHSGSNTVTLPSSPLLPSISRQKLNARLNPQRPEAPPLLVAPASSEAVK